MGHNGTQWQAALLCNLHRDARWAKCVSPRAARAAPCCGASRCGAQTRIKHRRAQSTRNAARPRGAQPAATPPARCSRPPRRARAPLAHPRVERLQCGHVGLGPRVAVRGRVELRGGGVEHVEEREVGVPISGAGARCKRGADAVHRAAARIASGCNVLLCCCGAVAFVARMRCGRSPVAGAHIVCSRLRRGQRAWRGCAGRRT